jgi:hypothetical protein
MSSSTRANHWIWVRTLFLFGLELGWIDVTSLDVHLDKVIAAAASCGFSEYDGRRRQYKEPDSAEEEAKSA